MIESIEAGGQCTYDVAPASAGLGERMSDFSPVAVPLSELRTPRTVADVVAGPGATTTVHVRSASSKVTVLDRTGYPVKGATVEVWSQIIGYTNGDGLYDSPLFYSGYYPLKIRAPFVGLPQGGADAPVLPFEVMQETDFPDGSKAITVQVGLAVSGLSTFDCTAQVFYRTITKVPGEVGHQLKEMISPLSIGIMVTLGGLWVASHFVGVGEAADVIFALTVAIKFGLTAAMAASLAGDLLQALQGIFWGQNEFALEQASAALARIIAMIGVIGLFKVAEGAAKKGVRNSYRPKGIPNEVIKEPPRSPNVDEALKSKQGQKLGEIMGDGKVEERLKGAEDCAKADPTLQKLPQTDAAAARGYTSHEVTKLGAASKEADYLILNRMLRFADKNGVKGAVEYIDAVVRALNRLPKFKGNSFRGMRFKGGIPDFINKLKPGMPFRDKGFFSTSVEEASAREYMNERPTEYPDRVMIYVRGYSGRLMQAITEVKTDHEALFRPGTYFVVVKRWVSADGVLNLSLVEIDETASEFVSTWGKGAAMVANFKALAAWAEKEAKKLVTGVPRPASAGAH